MERAEIIDAMKERLNSPVAGTYIITWCIYNWKAVVYLFSGKPDVSAAQVVVELEAYLEGMDVYLAPLLATAVYLMAYGWLVGLANRYRAMVDRKNLEWEANERRLATTARLRMAKMEELALKSEEVASITERLSEETDSQAELNNNLKEILETNQQAQAKLVEAGSERSELETKYQNLQDEIEQIKEEIAELESRRGDIAEEDWLLARFNKYKEELQRLNEKHLKSFPKAARDTIERTGNLTISDLYEFQTAIRELKEQLQKVSNRVPLEVLTTVLILESVLLDIVPPSVPTEEVTPESNASSTQSSDEAPRKNTSKETASEKSELSGEEMAFLKADFKSNKPI